MSSPHLDDMKSINTWWQKGIEKERQRFSNAPKAATPKHQFEVVETNTQFAPLPGQITVKKVHARRHR